MDKLTNLRAILRRAKEIKRHDLSPHEEALHISNARKGNIESRNILVTSNLLYVLKLASRFRGSSLDVEDIIGAGIEGLLIAADRADPKRGSRFIGYAKSWIRAKMREEVYKMSNDARYPLNCVAVINGINKGSRKFQQENGRLPTSGELAEKLGYTLSEVDRSLSVSHASMPASSARIVSERAPSWVPTIDDVESNLEATDAPTVRHEIMDIVTKKLKELCPEDAMILKMRYGIGGHKPATFINIQKALGLRTGHGAAWRVKRAEKKMKAIMQVDKAKGKF